jgi:hypothetical protein
VVIKVIGVDGVGRVTQVSIDSTGLFSRIPSNPVAFEHSTGNVFVQLNGGVSSVTVIDGGQGYSADSNISFAGLELDPFSNTFVSNFDLSLPLAYTTSDQREAVRAGLNSALNPWTGEAVNVGMIKAQVAGIQWQGDTRFDVDQTTFDSSQTRTVEFDTATETTWDGDQMIWDQNSTTFDLGQISRWPDYSQVYFDNNQTVFDWYATLFDARQPVYDSRWSRSYFWYFGQPQNNPQ